MSEQNTLDDFIDSIQDGNFNKSEELFNQMIGDKISTALDAEKQAIAANMFSEIDDEDVEVDVEDDQQSDD